MQRLFLGTLLGASILLAACASADEPEPLLGGDRDVHGCIPSAGYSWCEAKQKCLRVWEEPCE
ncbi:MAG: hypothetical protein PHW10_00450 [Candidatus Peribacteraceae bacterium]|nr:hypothetical protein [Candidatus Peribacteraceae bacterium]